MNPQKGFTLIELLIVITVIGILATMIVPNLSAAQDKAKEASVKSIMHTLQIAIESYNIDSGTYPTGSNLSVEDIYLVLIEDDYLKKIPINPFTKANYSSSDTAGQVYYTFDESTNNYYLKGYGRKPEKTLLELTNT
ncbi:type II secretion system protein [Candidatus Margulisiibacteriota bacterium]